MIALVINGQQILQAIGSPPIHRPPPIFIVTRRSSKPYAWIAAIGLASIIWSIADITFAQSPASGAGTDAEVLVPTDPAAVIAVVGQSPILWGDLKPKIDARIKEVLGEQAEQYDEQKIRIAQTNLARGLLAQSIQNKMLRESFLLEQVGTQAVDKRIEADAKLVQRARQMFRESELPELLQQYKTDDLTELDEQLKLKGSSLASRQRDFVDMMLGHLYIREKVQKDPKVSLSEILAYYETHLDDYRKKERVRWEQLSVYYSRVPNRQQAESTIASMGQEAYFGGSMTAVAKKSSHEPMASSGGTHDWIGRDALASEIMNEQLFSLPVGQMSEIIRDDVGLHIVRVLEHELPGVTPMAEIQDEIRAVLKKEKVSQSQFEAIDSMRTRVAVWTLFPEDVPGALPLRQSQAPIPAQSQPQSW